jgi:hypothetical protein
VRYLLDPKWVGVRYLLRKGLRKGKDLDLAEHVMRGNAIGWKYIQ